MYHVLLRRKVKRVAPDTTRRRQKTNELKWRDEEYKKSREGRRKLEIKRWKEKKKGDKECYKQQSKLCAELAVKKIIIQS